MLHVTGDEERGPQSLQKTPAVRLDSLRPPNRLLLSSVILQAEESEKICF